MTELETSIRQQLYSHVSGELTLAEFTDWLVSASWGMDSQADPIASRLTYAIERALAGRSDDILTADELTTTLRALSVNRPLAA